MIALAVLARTGFEKPLRVFGNTGVRHCQQLLVQLSSLLDSQRRHAEVNRLLGVIEADEWRQISPRERYDVWEPEGMDEVRAELDSEMRKGLEPLSAGLVDSPTTEGEGR